MLLLMCRLTHTHTHTHDDDDVWSIGEREIVKKGGGASGPGEKAILLLQCESMGSRPGGGGMPRKKSENKSNCFLMKTFPLCKSVYLE